MEAGKSAVQLIRVQRNSASTYRRKVALLSALGALDFSIISLYQLGAIRHLPDLPGKFFNSDYVNASREAQIAGIPDGPISLILYTANIGLAGMAIKRGRKRNVFDYLMAANTLGQVAGGAYYLFNMITVQKKVCLYCVTGALLNFATLVPLYRLFNKSR